MRLSPFPIVLFAVVAGSFALAACGDDPVAPKDPTELTFAAALDVDLDQMTKTASGLYYQDLLEGNGDVVVAGDSVTVHYEGWLHTGVKFDSSVDRGTPSSFSLNGVIAGWQEGIPGMKVGGKRKLVIPWKLGYGQAGSGPIPGYATLVFDVELLAIEE